MSAISRKMGFLTLHNLWFQWHIFIFFIHYSNALEFRNILNHQQMSYCCKFTWTMICFLSLLIFFGYSHTDYEIPTINFTFISKKKKKYFICFLRDVYIYHMWCDNSMKENKISTYKLVIFATACQLKTVGCCHFYVVILFI